MNQGSDLRKSPKEVAQGVWDWRLGVKKNPDFKCSRSLIILKESVNEISTRNKAFLCKKVEKISEIFNTN